MDYSFNLFINVNTRFWSWIHGYGSAMPWKTVKLQIPQLSSYLQKHLTFDSGEVHHRRRLKQQGQYRVSFISAIKCHLSDFINYPATHLVWGLDYKSTNHLKFFTYIFICTKNRPANLWLQCHLLSGLQKSGLCFVL